MKITKEVSLENFEAWSGGKDTLKELTSSECEQLESQLETTIELNGVKISISATFLGFFNWDADERVFDKHPKFRVTVVSNGQRQTFTYYGSIKDYQNNVQELDEKGLRNALECRLMDASSFDNARNFEDFCAEMGYERIEEYKKANKAWIGCAQAHAACQRMWGSYYELYNKLTEEE